MKYWSDGPMWPQGLDVDDCRNSWWRNLLYVNNLTPPYMLFLMFYVCLMKYWSDGPMWPQGLDVDDCRNSWWRNLLYVNNLVEPKQMVRFGS